MINIFFLILWLLCCFCLGCCVVLSNDEETAPAPVGAIPYPTDNPVTNQPTSMPLPNTDVGWTITRPQDQPYPELNSDCPYPPVLPYPPQSSIPSPSMSNRTQPPAPSAPYPTNSSSQEPQDCPPKYEDAINLIPK
ncbi:hypothetical protein ACKWTF_014199 [Chironomus riparius]